MSKKNVKKFFEEMERNQELKEKFTSSVNDKTTKSEIISFAESNGFSFSEDALQEYAMELLDNLNCNAELDEEEMQSAAGGYSKQTSTQLSIFSLGVWCALVSILSGPVKQESCRVMLSMEGGDKKCNDHY